MMRRGRDEIATIFQTTISTAFSWTHMYEFHSRFHCSLFLRFELAIIFQHWLRLWLGADQATSHYLNQWWLVYRSIYASLGLSELTHLSSSLGRYGCNFKNIILKLIIQNNNFQTGKITFTNQKSTLIQIMAWCHHATSHYLSQCWPKSMASLCLNELMRNYEP